MVASTTKSEMCLSPILLASIHCAHACSVYSYGECRSLAEPLICSELFALFNDIAGLVQDYRGRDQLMSL